MHKRHTILHVSLVVVLNYGFLDQAALAVEDTAKDRNGAPLDLRALHAERLRRQQQAERPPAPNQGVVRIINGEIVTVDPTTVPEPSLPEESTPEESTPEAAPPPAAPEPSALDHTLDAFRSYLADCSDWQGVQEATSQAGETYETWSSQVTTEERLSFEDGFVSTVVEKIRALAIASAEDLKGIDPRTADHPSMHLLAALPVLAGEYNRDLVATTETLLFAQYLAVQATDKKLEYEAFTAGLVWLSQHAPAARLDGRAPPVLGEVRQDLRDAVVKLIDEISQSLPPLDFGSDKALGLDVLKEATAELSRRLTLDIPVELAMNVDDDYEKALALYEEELKSLERGL